MWHVLFLVYEDDASVSDGEWARIARLFEKFERQVQWLNTTQSAVPSFRWRGQTEGHTLASGLDDYPRSSRPPEMQRHVDLHSWLAAAASSLARWADLLGETRKAASYRVWSAALVSTLLGARAVFVFIPSAVSD